jgi:hypothetical protein
MKKVNGGKMAGEKNFWKDFLGRFSHPIIGAFTFYWLLSNGR